MSSTPEPTFKPANLADWAKAAAKSAPGGDLNALNWIAQQENLIAIRPKEPEDRRITLTADQHQRIMLLSLLIIPGLVISAGVFTWWRRR